MGEGGKEKAPIGPALEFFAGTLAGVGSLFVGHPFDTSKYRPSILAAKIYSLN